MTANPEQPDRDPDEDDLDDEGPLPEDLQQEQEQDEEPLPTCRACGKVVEEDDDRCPHCGRPIAQGCMRWWVVVLIVAITALIVWLLIPSPR